MFRCLVIATVLSSALGTFPAAAQEQQIRLSAAQVARLGIGHGEASVATRQPLAVMPGRITAPLDARLTMAAPFAGTVLSVGALEGAGVHAGDELLVIASNDYLAAQSRYSRVVADYQALTASVLRLRTLSDEGIVARARLETAEAELAGAEAEREAMAQLLAQVKPVRGQQGAYSLVAPREAIIAQLAVTPGDTVGTLDGAVVIESAGDLWLEAALPSRLLGQVSVGDAVTLETYGVEGRVIAVGRVIDQHSRAVTLRAVMDGHPELNPGQSVQATIFAAAPEGTLSVPRAALVRLTGKDIVFVLTEGGYQSVDVTVFSRGADDAIVAGRLAPGARVAVSGLTELKALAMEGQ